MLFLLAAPVIFTYWVEPCTRPETACQKQDAELAQWALEAWQRASGGQLLFRRVDKEDDAQIRVHWVEGRGGLYGEARPMMINGKRGAIIRVLPDTNLLSPDIAAAAARDALLRHAIVYLTCLHESGHAIGLPHTAAFDDIMYSFGFGGDIAEYFARYRRKLKQREDIAREPGISPHDREQLKRLLLR